VVTLSELAKKKHQKTGKVQKAIERMRERGSPNLQYLLDEKEKWEKDLNFSNKELGTVVEIVEFVDYLSPEVARTLIEKNSKILKLYRGKIDEYERAVCKIGCEASINKTTAMEMVEELAEEQAYQELDRGEYEGDHERLIL